MKFFGQCGKDRIYVLYFIYVQLLPFIYLLQTKEFCSLAVVRPGEINVLPRKRGFCAGRRVYDIEEVFLELFKFPYLLPKEYSRG